MNLININNMNATQSLSEIAKMAYGSGDSEKTAGGKGNIGIFNGHVVKFNTHLSERMSSTTDDMRASCNQLRTHLQRVAYDLLIGENSFAHSKEVFTQRADAYNTICKDLGLQRSDGKAVTNPKALLDRKVVAKVLNTLSQAAGITDVWDGAVASADTLASKGINTRFAGVKNHFRPSALVQSSYTAKPANPKESKMVKDALFYTAGDIGAWKKGTFHFKVNTETTNVKIRENRGGGSCFFYSALQQMSNGKLESLLLPEDRKKLNHNFSDNKECVNALRNAFIAHSKQIVSDLKASLQSSDTGTKCNFIKEGDFYRLKLPDFGDGKFAVEPDITEPMKLIENKKFENYSEDADVMHGAFLADFLKRPVTIIMDIPRHGGEVDKNARPETLTFNRSLTDNTKFEGDPIVIYYNRSSNGNTGHFRAVTFEGPEFGNA